MPITEVAAKRYATALIDVAAERGLGDRCQDDMRAFQAVVERNRDVMALLADPTVPVSAATAIVRQLSERLALDATSVSFLCILASRRRLDGLARIITEYAREMDRRAGRAAGVIVSAAPVTDGQAARITDAVSRRTGISVTLTRRIDPSLLGGLQVVVGDRVFDLSTRTYLETLKNRLLHNR